MARFVHVKYNGELPDGMKFKTLFNCYDEVIFGAEGKLSISQDGRFLADGKDTLFHGYICICNFDKNKDGPESIHNYWVKFTDGILQDITTKCPMNIYWRI